MISSQKKTKLTNAERQARYRQHPWYREQHRRYMAIWRSKKLREGLNASTPNVSEITK